MFETPAMLMVFMLTKNRKYFEQKVAEEGDTYVNDGWLKFNSLLAVGSILFLALVGIKEAMK
jgi:hypothetical protein